MSPPFRAEQVGSLLRPAALRTAHEQYLEGKLDAAALKDLQDSAIRDAIAMQESIGLQVITDGEFRRSSFSSDFIEKLEGAKSPGAIDVANAGRAPGESFAPRSYEVTAHLAHVRPIEAENFKFVRAHTQRTAKQAMPSPTMLLRGGRDAVSRTAYPDLAEFHADLAKVYVEELRSLAEVGCSYVQLDDTNYAYFCDPAMRERFRAWGYVPEELPALQARIINAIVAGKPAGMTIGIHMCRGNNSGKWAAQGAYEPIAESIFNALDVDAYFLEYDDARSGGFEPLRFYPKGSTKRVVLGLVSTKTAVLESKDALKRRIDEAAKYVPLANLSLSPQCGFASTFRGNPLTQDDQRRKLERIVEVAREVWQSA